MPAFPAISRRPVLVVDDDPGTSGVLEHILRSDGHDVVVCDSGPEALALVASVQPDLILLDIDMPAMSGYEVCERLKVSEPTSDIPVLFVSGRTRAEDTLAGFQAGGIDYISKPFQAAEVLARVRAQLRLRELQRVLEARNEQLEAAVAMRTRELAEAHARLLMLDQTKDEFLRIISHELRTPLNGVLGISELVFDHVAASGDYAALRQAYNESRQRIESLLDQALTLVDLDVGKRALPIDAVPVRNILSRAAALVADVAQSAGVVLQVADSGDREVPGEEVWLSKAMHALLDAAVRLSGRGAVITVRAADHVSGPLIVIQNADSVVSSEVIDRLFEMFAVRESEMAGGGIGLGPPMAQRILALFQASVRADALAPQGFRFTIAWRSRQG